ncbi:MAG: hypothetical protein IT422_22530 [Pirellulaceae bacterium]|nr:hypothetical protein [Pirellulaceae bacterium]
MAVFRYTREAIVPLTQTTFAQLGIGERADLQRLLRANINVIGESIGLVLLVIGEEFGDWDDSRRRIDLLALDKSANLVVIELKRTEDGGHMELQAIRYASMVSTMTFEQAVDMFAAYLQRDGDDRNAKATILDFLGWDEPSEDEFAADVKLVLASAEFSKELTTAVLWLRDRAIDIRCVRIRPYGTLQDTLLDVQQIVPLPEAEDYQVRVREKNQQERAARSSSRDYTRYRVTVDGEVYENLPKRRTAHRIIKALIEAGACPAALQAQISWKPLWLKADGRLSDEEMCEHITARGTTQANRWFTADNELVFHEGATYAISNQWGGRTVEAMDKLLACHKSQHITFEAI